MDRNSIIGLVLIGAILIGFSIYTKPKREAQLEAQRIADSIAMVENIQRLEAANREAQERTSNQTESAVDKAEAEEAVHLQQEKLYGDFASGLEGEQEFITMENKLLKVKFSTLGGRPYSAILKKYQTWDSVPVRLFDGDSTIFALQFFADNKRINTNELYFVPEASSTALDASKSEQKLVMRLDISESAYIDYIYKMSPGQYMMDFEIKWVGLDRYRTDNMVFNWDMYFRSTEKGYKNESMYTTLFYRYKDGDIEKFNPRSKSSLSEETATTQVDWIAFKHQFFSTIIIAKDYFEGAYMTSEKFEDGEFIRHYTTEIDVPFNRGSNESMAMNLYFGPNEHTRLKKYEDLQLKSLVTVGGPVIRFLNEWVIIPIFNWLNRSITNYGLIILLLTLILKTALFPLTYRSYKSQAVMRVLKPQVDEIGEKFPKKEDAMKKQQATMALYKKAGANPLGGCLPMVAQMPILYAMFRFFPTSIELRQEKFLWATDLSTYDSILDLPFTIPAYGDHVSLFTILMTVTTVLSMRINNQTQANSAMPGMKTMMYIMPVMFMFILNGFSAALTYYYFLANLITLAQNFLFKYFTDEEKILKKINSKAASAKPKKKSKWQQRMEEMQKQQKQLQKGKKR